MCEIPMELLVWGGNWGLPSVDIRSLQMITYTKLCGAPVTVIATNNPFQSPGGSLPVFKHGKVTITKYTEFVRYLAEKNYSADASLTPEQQAEVFAYVHLLEQKLWPATLHTWYTDEKNYTEITRPWMAGVLPIPFNYYYPGHYQRRTEQRLKLAYGTDEFNMIEREVYRESSRCLNILVSKLESRHFFLGSSPTSLDAFILGAIAPFTSIPYPNAQIGNHIKGCPTLMEFIQRLTRRCFPAAATSSSTPKAKKSPSNDDSDFPNKRRHQFFAFLTAVGATLLYALYSGILQLEFVPSGHGDVDEFFEDDDSHDS